MEIGVYNGFYQFDNQEYVRQTGFVKTYFTIAITDSVGHNFNGWVEDDLLSGGTEGRGTVSGKLYSNGIKFVKNMPYLSVITRDNNTGKYFRKVDKTKKHWPIYYDGVEIGSDNYRGSWVFKYGVLMRLLIWISGAKTGGTWEMSKVK